MMTLSRAIKTFLSFLQWRMEGRDKKEKEKENKSLFKM
jgi:hypothetical protein